MTGFCTLDTGALIALDRGNRGTTDLVRRLVAEDWLPVVPAPVVAESWRSPRQVVLARTLASSRVVPLDADLARRAGELNGRAGLDDPVDAAVVVTAAALGGLLLTADPHLSVLVGHLPPGGPPLVVRPPS
jgi:hypothetical protein